MRGTSYCHPYREHTLISVTLISSDYCLTLIEERMQEKFGITSFDYSKRKVTTHFDAKNNLEDVIKSVIRREISTKQSS